MSFPSHLLVHLPYLSEVSRFNSFTRAAEHLNVTQAAVSYQVRELEKKVGNLLVIRQSGGKTRLTAAGESLVEEYNYCAKRLRLAFDSLDYEKNRGVLRVTTPIDFGSLVMPRVMARLKASAPALEVQCHTSDEVFELGQSSWDMAITSVPFEETSCDHIIFSSPLKVVASPDYIRASGGDPDTMRLSEHILLCRANSKNKSWKGLLENFSLEYGDMSKMEFGNTFALVEAAKCGLGIAVLPAFCVDEALHDKTLEPLLFGVQTREARFQLRSVSAPQIHYYEKRLKEVFDDIAKDIR